jgi:octaprenyl-diphosphate synthase
VTGRALGCRSDDLYTLGASVEMLHAATLLHDDILDNAPLRRGQPAAHTLYGSPMVILAGDTMLAQALLMLVSTTEDARITSCLARAVMHTIEGELGEFANLRNLDLTHEDYEEIITGKTACMFRASCEIGAFRAGANDAQVKAAGIFGLELGIAFQMVDDALDFAPSAQTGKPTGGDLREGKVTPPLLMYLEDLPLTRQEDFRERFAAETLSEAELSSTVTAVHKGGYAQRTREAAFDHLEKARAALFSLPENRERDILSQMIEFIQLRDL